MEPIRILTREQWGAQPPKSVRPVLPHQFTTIELHHSATEILGPVTAARQFQRYHMQTQGWKDIFYNWLIHPDGTVLEGRGWGTSARAENPMTFCLIGNYDTDPITEPQSAAIEYMRDAAIKRMPQLAGDVAWHNQRASTACPGANTVVWVTERNNNKWVKQVDQQKLDGLYEQLDGLTRDIYEMTFRAQRLQNKATVLEEQALETLARARAIRHNIKETN